MKDKKDKRKHHESTIGKIIYGFLLFAPLLAILSTCLYATFNKNAYLSYNDKYVSAESQVTNTNAFAPQQTYKAIYTDNETTTQYGMWVQYTTISIDWHDYGFEDLDYNMFRLFDTGLIQIRTTSNIQYQIGNIWGNTLKEFYFTFQTSTFESWQNGDVNYYVIYETKESLDNAFFYSIEKVEKSSLFNWSKNTAIYTVLNNTSNTLGITNTFWPMLMAYWLIISVIYILYDIVLMMLVIFHRKVHCLQDSI